MKKIAEKKTKISQVFIIPDKIFGELLQKCIGSEKCFFNTNIEQKVAASGR